MLVHQLRSFEDRDDVIVLGLQRRSHLCPCDAATRNLPEVCRRVEILIAAIGKPATIIPDMVRPGATVIDVGINHITDRATFQRFAGDALREKQFAEKGSTLVGDVHPSVAEVAGDNAPLSPAAMPGRSRQGADFRPPEPDSSRSLPIFRAFCCT